MINGAWRSKGGSYISWKLQIEVTDQGTATLVPPFNYAGLKALTEKLRSELSLEQAPWISGGSSGRCLGCTNWRARPGALCRPHWGR